MENKQKEALAKISAGRERTNILKKSEQNAIAFLVQRMPKWISSDGLTLIGFIGSLIVFLSFVLAKYVDSYWLLLNIVGFGINWFGDSLDGRLAYYRNTPRKWYGFSLDITVDWLTNILIGLGLSIYIDADWQLLGAVFVMLYGWSMIIALLRYKITNKYSIDSSFLGPTEVRIIISAIFCLEVFVPNSIIYTGSLACLVLLVINIIDFISLLKMADERDIQERIAKSDQEK